MRTSLNKEIMKKITLCLVLVLLSAFLVSATDNSQSHNWTEIIFNGTIGFSDNIDDMVDYTNIALTNKSNTFTGNLSAPYFMGKINYSDIVDMKTYINMTWTNIAMLNATLNAFTGILTADSFNGSLNCVDIEGANSNLCTLTDTGMDYTNLALVNKSNIFTLPQTINANLTVHGNMTIYENLTVNGTLTVEGDLITSGINGNLYLDPQTGGLEGSVVIGATTLATGSDDLLVPDGLVKICSDADCPSFDISTTDGEFAVEGDIEGDSNLNIVGTGIFGSNLTAKYFQGYMQCNNITGATSNLCTLTDTGMDYTNLALTNKSNIFSDDINVTNNFLVGNGFSQTCLGGDCGSACINFMDPGEACVEAGFRADSLMTVNTLQVGDNTGDVHGIMGILGVDGALNITGDTIMKGGLCLDDDSTCSLTSDGDFAMYSGGMCITSDDACTIPAKGDISIESGNLTILNGGMCIGSTGACTAYKGSLYMNATDKGVQYPVTLDVKTTTAYAAGQPISVKGTIKGQGTETAIFGVWGASDHTSTADATWTVGVYGDADGESGDTTCASVYAAPPSGCNTNNSIYATGGDVRITAAAINKAGLIVDRGGICVDDDGSCVPPSNGSIYAAAFMPTANPDIAEMVKIVDDGLVTGDVVCAKGKTDNEYGEPQILAGKCTKQYDSTIIGVLSNTAGVVLNARCGGGDKIHKTERVCSPTGECHNEEIIIDDTTSCEGFDEAAFSGSIDINVNCEDPIEPGDLLVSDGVSGKAMRYDKNYLMKEKAKAITRLFFRLREAIASGKTEQQILDAIDNTQITYEEPESQQVVIAKALESCLGGNNKIKGWLR